LIWSGRGDGEKNSEGRRFKSQWVQKLSNHAILRFTEHGAILAD